MRLMRIRWAREIVFLSLAACFLSVLFLLRGILFPVFIALLLAYVVDPVVTNVEKRRGVPRAAGSALFLLFGLLFAVYVFGSLVPLVVEQGYRLADTFPGYLDSLTKTVSAATGVEFREAFALPGPEQLLSLVGGAFWTMAVFLLWCICLPFFFFFFSWQFPSMRTAIFSRVPARERARVRSVLTKMDRAISAFFRGRLLVCVITGFMMAAGWFLTGVEYWLLFGLLTGLLGIAPYLSYIGLFFVVLLQFLSAGPGFDLMSVVVWPVTVFIAANIVEEWILTPWIQSVSVKMNAVTILIAILIGGSVAGVGGLLFAIPVASALKILNEEFVMPKIIPESQKKDE